MFIQANPTLAQEFQRTRKQFRMSIVASITAYNTPVQGTLLGTGNIQLPLGDIFFANEVYATAIDDEGIRLTPSATFDRVEVNMIDQAGGYTYTNGMVDLMSFYEQGRNKDFVWGFYPQEQFNVIFQAIPADQAGAGIATLPFYAQLVLIGTRYPRPEFLKDYSQIEEMLGLQ